MSETTEEVEAEEPSQEQVFAALLEENKALRLRLATTHGKLVALVGKITPKGTNVPAKDWTERRRRDKAARASRKRNRRSSS